MIFTKIMNKLTIIKVHLIVYELNAKILIFKIMLRILKDLFKRSLKDHFFVKMEEAIIKPFRIPQLLKNEHDMEKKKELSIKTQKY